MRSGSGERNGVKVKLNAKAYVQLKFDVEVEMNNG